MGLVSNMLQRSANRQKLRQWAADDRLGDFSDVRVVRRYEEDEAFVDLYWFVYLAPSDEMIDSRFTRSLWTELETSIQQIEDEEIMSAIDDFFREKETISLPEEPVEPSLTESQELNPIEPAEPSMTESLELNPIEPAEQPVLITVNDTIKPIESTPLIQPKMDKVAKRQKRIIALLKKNPYMTMPKMARRLRVSRPTITRDICDMKQSGLIRRVGAVKNGYWELLS